MKKIIKFIIGVAVSIFFLYFAFIGAEIEQVLEIIKKADINLLLTGFLVCVAGFFLKTYRWKFLGEKYAGLSWLLFFRAGAIGHMLSIFLPFRVGDLGQGYFLSRNTALPNSYTFSTVFLERLIDFGVVLIIVLSGSFFIVLPDFLEIKSILILFIAIIGAILVLVGFHDKISGFLFGRANSVFVEHIKNFYGCIIKSLRFLKDKRVLCVALPLTLLKWFVFYGLSTSLILRALEVQINYFEVLFVIALTALSALIPASPGQIGTWEYFCIVALGVFNVDRNTALSYALLTHAISYLPAILFGLYFFIDEVCIKKQRFDILKEGLHDWQK